MPDQQKSNIFVVIPAYNEDKAIYSVVKKTRSLGLQNIIVVNDGSTDNTLSTSLNAGAQCISHKINRGKGAATKTGIEAAKKLDAQIVVTIDGDGQHDPGDINNLIKPIINCQADVVLGTRSFNLKTMPLTKIAQNYTANLVTKLLYGYSVSDSQSGFRAYSRRALEVIETKSDSYEYESEIVREINWHKLSYSEIPIKTKYTTHSTTKTSRQSLKNGLKTLYKMIWNIISF